MALHTLLGKFDTFSSETREKRHVAYNGIVDVRANL